MTSGPSYSLRNRSGPKQRAVNLIPVPVEAGNEANRSAFKDMPGLVLFADLGSEIRGGINSNGRVLVATGSSLLELASDGATTNRGSIGGGSTWIDFAANATQICFTDSSSLYVLNRSTNALTTTADYPGGPRIDVLNEFLFMVDDTSGRVWWADVGDATNIDGLSFATAESAPDNLTACIVSNEELLLIGKSTIEPWRVVGGDEVIAKTGRVIEIGSASPYSVRRLDNSVFFVGSSEQYGQGVVYRLNGYTPQRISTRAEEEKLSGLDLSGAYAFSFLFEGDSFYALQVPGLDATLCFNLLSGMWFEAAELVNGDYAKWRANVHVPAFDKNLVGDEDGKLYYMSATTSNNDGDALCRSRLMPVIEAQQGKRLIHSKLQCTCDTGAGGTMMVRWSDDNGQNFGSWEYISMGEIGEFETRVQLHRLGSADRRIYELRVTDNVPWNPSDIKVTAR